MVSSRVVFPHPVSYTHLDVYKRQEQMYPVYLETARFQNEKEAERAFHFALEAEKIHVKMFQEAQNAAKQGKDMDLENVYVCKVCGHTYGGSEAPDQCPVCGAKKEMYRVFQ